MDDHDEEKLARDLKGEYFLTNSLNGLRACKVCTIIQSATQFTVNGCPNCTELKMSEERGRVNLCTTPHFEGLICILDKAQSWVGKYQRLQGQVKGSYAVRVFEKPNNDLRELMRRKDMTYVDRSTSS